jgi:peptidoglycan/LPS O-acetylase OafA/YrhL
MTPAPNPDARRFDLDWLRIGAFTLLMLYHVGMYYVPWDWHVKSETPQPGLVPWMFVTQPWRLTLLFLVSGVATAYLFAKLEPGSFLRQRSIRLLVPLVFGMLVIVPPQTYYEVVHKAGYADGYLAFYTRYLGFDRHFCRGDECLIVPTWNHLWFVAYLWVYTLVAVALRRAGGLDRAAAAASRWLSDWGVILWPLAWFALARLLLVQRFGSTHALVDDFYNHAIYLPAFLLGVACGRSEALWQAMSAMRWPAAAIALAGYGFVAWYFTTFGETVVPPDALRMTQRVLYAAFQWCAIVALVGFARRYITRDGPARRYLTDAIFPVYIVHQTVIIVAAWQLKPLQLAPALEAPLLIVLTAAAGVATYEVARRIAPLRLLFGLRRR